MCLARRLEAPPPAGRQAPGRVEEEEEALLCPPVSR